MVHTWATLLGVGLAVDVVHARWGFRAHETTAAIAEKYLNAQAQEAVNFLLGSGGLVGASTWADGVRGNPRYSPWSDNLHFFNAPDWACNYNHTRDCASQQCVTGAIEDLYALSNANLIQGQTMSKEEALKFLVHFVQDVYQPMHGGFISDRGGNDVTNINFNGGIWNLHSLWDSGLINKRVADDFNNDYSKYINYLINSSSPPSGELTNPRVYAQETAALACEEAYVDEDGNEIKAGDTISTAYYSAAIQIVEQRLVHAGEELAAILNHNLRLDGEEPEPGEPDLCLSRGCGDLDFSFECQCNDQCEKYDNCCSDYSDLCETCESRGCDSYSPSATCQCNSGCVNFDDCCPDYTDIC